MRSSNSVGLLCLVFCIWPLIFHFGWTWLTRTGGRIDWQHIEWPWRKND